MSETTLVASVPTTEAAEAPQQAALAYVGFPYLENYHKGLPHDPYGEVNQDAYLSLLTAISRPTFPAFEAVQLGLGRELTNPLAGFALDTEGPQPRALRMKAPPALDSAEAAAEAVELYWMALLRDVPFTQWATDPRVAQAAAELSGLQDFRGPKINGQVTPDTVFRGFTPGDLTGPYLSQFLVRAIPYGSLTIPAKQKTVLPNRDYLTGWEDFLAVQNGRINNGANAFDATSRLIRSLRDLGQYVHVDALYEAYLNACLILLALGAELDDGNPYKTAQKQEGFATLGGPHVLSLVTEVATRALKAVWYQKWSVWRRLRPEAYGGLVHVKVAGVGGVRRNYPLHPQVLNSQALAQTFAKTGTYLLPQAFPEGSPTHPSYGSGHATVAGACVTILKAWFREEWVVPNPVVPTADGTGTTAYTGGALTLGGELNKVAANIAIGRNAAGVHWRSDYAESVRLGEQVALEILREQSTLLAEPHSFTVTRFRGDRVTVRDGAVFDAAGNRLPLGQA